MTLAPVLKAPFPYPGGKSRVADLVWQRLGDVDNYVEPFAGSLAVLLRRPGDHFRDGYRVETVNDASHYLVNFWRAVQRDPEAVAAFADNPVFEADLHARHKWLVRSSDAAKWRERMRTDPDAFDAKIAGWWVWGQCCWIGGAWCVDDVSSITPETKGRPSLKESGEGGVAAKGDEADSHRRPSFSFNNLGPGVRRDDQADRDALTRNENQRIALHEGNGIHAGRPQLTDAFDIGRGVNGGGAELCRKQSPQMPELPGDAGAFGRGVCASAGDRSYQERRIMFAPGGLGVGVNVVGPTDGTCERRRDWLVGWMQRLADRLRLVRTCYGHWSRICDSDSTMIRLGLTGVFLDPPYPTNRGDNGKKSRDPSLYVNDKHQCLDALRDEVLAWCRKWSGPQVRIAVCGYEGDGYEALVADGWLEVEWEASGGYANQRRKGKGKSANAKRERIWFSPACLRPGDSIDLFSEATS